MADKDFFLSPDDAQTMGDINYMRKSVRVKRTFPKTLKNKDGFAIEKEVSASDARDTSNFNRNGIFNSTTNSNSSANSQTDFKAMAEEIKSAQPAQTNSQEQRSKTDTNLDMFRNMARNIKRR
ncbi:MAG: hypothetical protein QNJ41_02305 [Xenococcaceae cyanobacterium MO_188.B32]|nr:hypothetical protein [Xenococcaceae cyanobacterium MO_188.B32]